MYTSRSRARRHRQAGAPERPAERGQHAVAQARQRHLRRHVAGDVGRLPSDRRCVHVPGRVEGDAQRQEREERGGVAPGDHRRQPHRRRRLRHRPRVPVRGPRAAHRRRGVPRGGVAGGARRQAARSGWCGAAGSRCSSPPCSASRSRACTPPGCRSTTSSTPAVLRDVLDTRYGRVALVRARAARARDPAAPTVAAPPSRGRAPAALVVVRRRRRRSAPASRSRPASPATRAAASRPGCAIPADLVHVAGMACWLGGLVVLCIAVLPRRDVEELRQRAARGTPRSRSGAIVALVVSGAYQAWRQVGSIDELKSTDYGRLLIAKLVAFAALIVAAAFSREIVNRRFRALPPDDDEFVPAEDPVLVGAGAPVVSGGGQRWRPTAERRRLRRRWRRRRRVGRRGRGPGGDDPPAPLGVGRGRHRGGDPDHHRAARERGAGALGDESVRSRSR